MTAVRYNNKIKAQTVLGQARKAFGNPEGLAQDFAIEEVAPQGEENQGKTEYLIVARLNRPLGEFPEADQRILNTMHVEAPEDAEDDAQEPQGGAVVTQEDTQGATGGQGGTQPQEGPGPAQVNPTPAQETEVEGFDGRKGTATIPVGAGRKGLPVVNGIALPASWTQTRQLWDTLNRLSKEKGRMVVPAEARPVLIAEGFTENTISTQFSRWAAFWGFTDDEKAAAKAAYKEAGANAELTPEQKEAQRLMDEAKAAEKEMRALERQEANRLKAIEKEERRAAERRSKEEARKVEAQQRSAEREAERQKRLAESDAIRAERAQAAVAEAQKRADEARAALEARRAEIAQREAEARARIQAELGKSAEAPAA